MANKLVTITDYQVNQIKKGNYADFIKNMVRLVASFGGKEIESIQGPYKSLDDEGVLLVINFKGGANDGA